MGIGIWEERREGNLSLGYKINKFIKKKKYFILTKVVKVVFVIGNKCFPKGDISHTKTTIKQTRKNNLAQY